MYMLKKITGRSQIKKKDRKKSICCWLVGSMAMFLLAGCGSPQGAEKQETTVEAEVPADSDTAFLRLEEREGGGGDTKDHSGF